MAIIKKYNPNIVYLSERLKNRLDTLTDFSLTIVEAPTGYGKSTTVKEYLKNKNISYIWFNIDNDDKEKFFNDFCTRIKNVSEECCRRLMSIGYPTNSEASTIISKALMDIDFRETTVLVLDNYHYVSDEFTNIIINDLSNNNYSNLKVVCLTQAITSKFTLDLVLKKKLNYIGKDDFELSSEEIFEYFKMSGIKLEDSETAFLYKYTEGWISALYLQMLSYVSTNSFEPTVDIDNLVCKAIWDNLTQKEKDFLICMSVFDCFTIRQALYVYENKITEEEIRILIEKSGFIKYDSKTRKYYIHTILMYFLENEFEKLEAVFKKKIYKGAGDWCFANENHFDAICYYYKIKDYKSIMSMDFTIGTFNNLNLNQKKYKKMFLDIIENTPYSVKKENIKIYLVLMCFLFIYNKRDRLDAESDNIRLMINELHEDESYIRNIKGNFYFLQGLRAYNNLDEMYSNYVKAYDCLKNYTDIYASMGSCTFGCPSVVSLYHRETGKLDEEIDKIHKLMPLYYKLTDGKGKGEEAVMKAEALFLRGNFEDAVKLCNKAIYMAETRNETNIYICANFVLARIACFTADYGKLNGIIEEVNRKIEEEERYDLMPMNDLCIGYVKLLMDEETEVPGWLKSGETIEDNTTIYNLGFANIIFGRFLIHEKKYELLESIAGQMFSIAGVYNNIIYKIYTCIYLAVAKVSHKDMDKAKKILAEALDYSMEDMIFIPFVENISEISELISQMELDTKYRSFIKEIKNYAKKYTKGLRTVMKASKSDHRYGLTNRELEVAKLAAQRLSNKEIADMLFIAESTVKSNMKIVFSKLGINSRNDLKNFF